MARRFSWEPYEDIRGWVRGLLISLAAAAFFTVSGAFSSGHVDPAVAFVYWTVLLVLGYAWGAFISRYVMNARWAPQALWARVLLVSVLLAVPYTAVVAAASTW